MQTNTKNTSLLVFVTMLGLARWIQSTENSPCLGIQTLVEHLDEHSTISYGHLVCCLAGDGRSMTSLSRRLDSSKSRKDCQIPGFEKKKFTAAIPRDGWQLFRSSEFEVEMFLNIYLAFLLRQYGEIGNHRIYRETVLGTSTPFIVKTILT